MKEISPTGITKNVATFTKPADFAELKKCINKILSFYYQQAVKETK